MKKSYFIVGIDYDRTLQRVMVNGVDNKIDAMKNFIKINPKALIISICELNQKEKDWVNKNNMPECENIDL